jgi:hypothetical protein
VFVKKEIATLNQRVEILDWLHGEGKGNQTRTAQHFDKLYPNLKIKQPLISKWIKKEEEIRKQHEKSNPYRREQKHVRESHFPEITEMLELWVARTMRDKIQISGDALKEKWKDFATLMGIKAEEWIELSNGWLDGIKRATGLKEFKRHGEALSADPVSVEEEQTRVQGIITESGLCSKDVFNMDETGLFWVYVCFDFTSTAH